MMFYGVFSNPIIPNRFEQFLEAKIGVLVWILEDSNIGFVVLIPMNNIIDVMMIHHTMRN
ncbi:hypothetical protein HanIR_Chr10g0466751 [Helianthus annuus]|nr:hypothetical protein HanIR_Chr10g0466751 [Helianthus annuus]